MPANAARGSTPLRSRGSLRSSTLIFSCAPLGGVDSLPRKRSSTAGATPDSTCPAATVTSSPPWP